MSVPNDIIDGVLCMNCRELMDPPTGYPVLCDECLKTEHKPKLKRRDEAERDFPAAEEIACMHGMNLVRRSDHHYQLSHVNGWLQNIYPGNQRLYWDRNKPKPPFLQLPDEWGLVDVVKAAVEASP